MSQQTRRFSGEARVFDKMPGGFTVGSQMFNENFNFQSEVELLGVPKDDVVSGSKLTPSNIWRVSNGHKQYDYAGGFNTQKEGNINIQGLDAMQLYPVSTASGEEYSAPAISFTCNSGIDHQSSEINSVQFQLPGFPQSTANQALGNIDQEVSRESWQSGAGLNELLLLQRGNSLRSNNPQYAPQIWGNSSLQPSTSQWCEQSSLETKLGGNSFSRADAGSVQGLSLSLSSDSRIQVQPFESTRLVSCQGMVNKSADFLSGSKAGHFSHQSRSEGILSTKRRWNSDTDSFGQFACCVKQSKYLKPSRELLYEFCNVAEKGEKGNAQSFPKQKHLKSEQEGYCKSQSIAQIGHGIEASISISGTAAEISRILSKGCASDGGNKDRLTFPGDTPLLRTRKAKLQWMLDEVERRYRHYREQLKLIVTGFEFAAGVGAATAYTYLAAKAMSRHFKCLKDAILGQIRSVNELLGEKDSNIRGITKGETPRLKILEQSLRQQLTFHQFGTLEQDAWRPQRGLPQRAVTVLRAWLFEHFLNPYPSDADKHLLARQTSLSRNQVSNWFINARVRLWKPMIEEMYQEEAREAEMEHTGHKDGNPNTHQKHEAGVSDSNGLSQEFHCDKPFSSRLNLAVESPENVIACSFKGNISKIQSANMNSFELENSEENVPTAKHELCLLWSR
ncbi:hypothetical protein SUGI_0433700 [Cryptomeria japonica]|nr:hypothetical protein SUGI_0433700 [Cryptomeria japonica]